MGVVFFLCLVAITPFAVGPDQVLLARIGPAILWISALLATLLGLDRLFQADAEDGSLDLVLMSDTPLELVVLVKCLAHWLLTGLPLVAASPIFGLMLGLDTRALAAVVASLALGTPALTLIGAIGAALTVSLRRGGLLLAILILPLSIPILIFGVAAANGAMGFADSLPDPLRPHFGGARADAVRRSLGAAAGGGMNRAKPKAAFQKTASPFRASTGCRDGGRTPPASSASDHNSALR